MNSTSETQINLKTIQRVDSDIVEIIDNASQVAIYKYNKELEKWEGTDIEGSLFLFKRRVCPRYGFLIVNRMNTDNFIECITKEMQFHLQEPYLLYRNKTGDIIGSWFYEEKHLKRIHKKIQGLVQEEEEDSKENIMSMLQQAHKDYMQQHPSEPEPLNLNLLPDDVSVEKIPRFPSPMRSISLQPQHDTPRRRRLFSTGSIDHIPNKWASETLDDDFLITPGELEPFCAPITSQSHSVRRNSLNQEGKSEEIHTRMMKQELTRHTQENPQFLLRLHEAYVSSLKSLFIK